ncbi:hypothetical protein GYA49_04485 [Candidatus Beckwithbacteria bacterium]|nr:hypothetical protein [Candidatus Beckwithbacteria bacterium]
MNKNIIVGFFVILVFFIILVSSSAKPYNPQDNTSQKQQEVVQETASVSTTPKYEYEILERIEDKMDENISVLIKPGEPNSEAIAEEVHKTCKKSCNISIYDDKKAFELDAQYTNMLGSYETEQEDLTKWKEDNYVFVGDHLVALVGYGDTENWGYGPYTSYPMKDWYYKELKGIE